MHSLKIVDLCVNKVLLLSLDNQLLKIDQIYAKELEKYNKNIHKQQIKPI